MLAYPFITIAVFIVYALFIQIIRLISKKKVQFIHFSFSNINYHILIFPFVIAILIQSIASNDSIFLVLFIVFAITGVIGETLFSLLWDLLFDKKFWQYNVSTIFYRYSSLLNFIPWGVGGIMFMSIINSYDLQNQFANRISVLDQLFQLWVIFAILMIFIMLSRLFMNNSRRIVVISKKFEFLRLNLLNYLIFCAPFLIGLASISLLYSWHYLILAILMGVIAFIAEYLFGKACVLFVSKRLWDYTYFTFDQNHITPLSIIPFSMAGFYFWTIAEIVFTVI